MLGHQQKHKFLLTKPMDWIALECLYRPHLVHQSLAIALASSAGISGKFVSQLCQVIPKNIICGLLGISPVKFQTISDRKLSRWQSEAIWGLCKVWGLLMMHFKKRQDLAASWLTKGKRPLCGEKPINLMSSGNGRKAVIEIIDRLETGDFS